MAKERKRLINEDMVQEVSNRLKCSLAARWLFFCCCKINLYVFAASNNNAAKGWPVKSNSWQRQHGTGGGEKDHDLFQALGKIFLQLKNLVIAFAPASFCSEKY